MSKRKREPQFFLDQKKKKHTLDSDEEDSMDESNVLDENDIEGAEDGIARHDGEQKVTAFNMQEELEEGHFDRDGHFIWNNEREVRDNWLDNIDWQKIEENPKDKYKINDDSSLEAESDSEDEPETGFDEINVYKQMISFMKPKENVNKAITRLGGDDTKLSSVERLKRKKAGTLKTSEDVTKLTELANQILTRLGNMNVYQETFEEIQQKITKEEIKEQKLSKEPELDMYADDFDVKEKEKLKDDSCIFVQPKTLDDTTKTPIELKWEFKWTNNDEKIEGPFNTEQMIKWQRDNYFKTGVMVRKHGENSNFYSLGRIDFELYE